MDRSLAELVHRAAAGDDLAFAILAEERWAPLVRLARSVVGDGEAEDAVQDGLVVAWRKLPSLRDATAFESWLGRVVLRVCLRRCRRRRLTLALDEVAEPAAAPAAEDATEVGRLLAALAPRQRAVLHLTAVEGRSDGEIAGLLGITAASVRSHRRRARERLSRLLEGAPT